MRRPRINGARGVALLAGALYCFVRAIAYLPLTETPSELPTGLQLITAGLPIEFWAVLWLVVGVLCAVMAFRFPDYMAWGLLVGMMTAWSLAYLAGWVLSFFSPGGASREYLNASTYGLPAVMVALLSSRLVGLPRSTRGAKTDGTG